MGIMFGLFSCSELSQLSLQGQTDSVKPLNTLNVSPFSLFMKPFILHIMGLTLAQTDFRKTIPSVTTLQFVSLNGMQPTFSRTLIGSDVLSLQLSSWYDETTSFSGYC